MTPSQQTALTTALALLGITPTSADWTAIDAYVTARNDAATAAYFQGQGHTTLNLVSNGALRAWCYQNKFLSYMADNSTAVATYREFVLFLSGLLATGTDLDVSKTALGQANTAIFTALSPTPITVAQLGALVALATMPVAVSTDIISHALNGA